MTKTLLRDAIRRGLRTYGVVGVTLACGTAALPAMAQDQTSQQPERLETITVTGSNIRRVDVETASPVITVDRAAIEKSGKLTLGDLLQDLPAITGPQTNPQVNNAGGNGNSSVGLRGLGSNRTLVLINGRRINNNDVNAVPTNMIERVEVLTDGASAVYGSDAIAGVVNLITRTNYQGAEFSADYGISDRDDGARRGYHFAFGQSTDKGSILAGVDYNKQEQVIAGNREFSRFALSLTTTGGVPTVISGGSTRNPNGYIQIPTSLQSAFPNCASGYLTRTPGAAGTNPLTDYHCFNRAAGDAYNYAAVNLDMTPQERTSAFLIGNYKLTDNVQAYLEVYHNKTTSSFNLAPLPTSVTDGYTISANSYYNPFGVDFSTSATGFDFATRLAALGFRHTTAATTSDQVSTGLKGSVDVLNQNWTWSAGFNYGHSGFTTHTFGYYYIPGLAPAIGPSFLDPATGTVRCGTPDAPISNCTPINIFNQDDPASIAAFQNIAASPFLHILTTQKSGNVDFSGGLFDLPAGTVQLAFGGNYTKFYLNQQVDFISIIHVNPVTGNATCDVAQNACSAPSSGSYNVKEGYAELLVPILKDLPFVRALNLTVGDRYSKYSNFGNTNNTKIAIEWRPIDDLLLRGTISEVFRAPKISDIFAGPASNADRLASDPCDHYTGSPVNPACVNVPTDGTFIDRYVQQALQFNAVPSGSNYAGTSLGPESGKSFDFGVVYDPHWLDGLSVSTDIWRIYLNNIIGALGAQNIMNLCSAGQTSYCSLIHRFPSGPQQGQLLYMSEPTSNLGRIDVKGVDFAATYRLPETRFGRFRVGINASYLSQYNNATAPGLLGNTVYHEAGHMQPFGSPEAGVCPVGVCLFPRWRALGTLNWGLGSFDATWTMRYIGRFSLGYPNDAEDQFPAGPGLPRFVLKYGATVYNNLTVGYNVEPINTRFDVGVDNLTDKKPPILFANNSLNANTDPSAFDLMGRYYWARVTVKF